MPQAIRVLIAEDDLPDCELIVRELRRAGFEPEWQRVDTEADYLSALEPSLDIVLSDYAMPRFDGLRALRLLKESGLDLPFILVSGTVGEDTAVVAMKEGASDYLIKDRLTRLGAAVRGALEQRDLRRGRARAEAELRRFVSASPAVIYALAVKEGALEHVWTSDNVTRLTGYSIQEAVGRTWWAEHLHPDDRDRVLAAHPTPYAIDHLQLEYRFEHKDGSWVWVRDDKRLLRDADGVPVEVVGCWADITERKQAEEAVREGEARLTGVVDSAMDAIITMDDRQDIVLFNAAAEKMFRCSRDQAMGQPIDIFIPARYQTRHQRDVQAFGTTGITSRAKGQPRAISGLRATGEEFPIEASISHTEVAGSRLYTVVLRDITERRRAERWQAMQHSVTEVLAHSNSLAAAAPGIIRAVCETLGGQFGAVWEIDTERNVLRCADVWRAPALAADELEVQTRQASFAPGVGVPGRVWASGKPLLVSDVAREGGFQRGAAAAEAGLRAALGFPILLRDAVLGVMDFLSPEMREAEPELLSMLAGIGSQIGQFIEHRLAEQQLRQAQKMEAIGQLAGGIAHDFNNIVGVILGYAELALREVPAENKASRRLEEIRKAAVRAASLTRQILTFSRRQPVEIRICDLNGIVEEMETMLRRLIGEDVRLAVALGEGLGHVRADPSQLGQVVMNLAVNARDAMPTGGRLIIETSNTDLDDAYVRSHPEARTGPHVLLAVADTGTGMDPAILGRLFEPFFTTKEPGKGTGLGLAVVYGIVKQSGGSISVHSEPGRGSTFRIYLPRMEPARRDAPVSAVVEAAGGSEIVLVVEDEPALRAIVVETLQMAGYTVLEASDPKQALGIASQSQRPIQLVITDVVLPGQSGPEMASQIRKVQPGARLLLMSGYADRLLDGDGVVESGTPFLGKPFTIDALLHKVRAVLDRRAP